MWPFLSSEERQAKRAHQEAMASIKQDGRTARTESRSGRVDSRQDGRSTRTALTGQLPGANAWDFADEFGSQLLDEGGSLLGAYLGLGGGSVGTPPFVAPPSSQGAATAPTTTIDPVAWVQDNPLSALALAAGAALGARKLGWI